MKHTLALTLVACVFFTANTAQAYPKPSVDRIAWQLDIKYGTPTRIAVQSPGTTAPKAYWYLPITVSNNTGDEQQFLPEIDMVDDNGVATRSDKDIPKDVFDAIKRKEGTKLMIPLGKASGAIHQGPDEIIETVAIWAEPLERMGSFSIFINGLSGESIWFKDGRELKRDKTDRTGKLAWYKDGVKLKDPADTEPDPAKKRDWKVDWTTLKPADMGEVLRKTLELDFQVPGDQFYQGRDVILLKKEVWIMR